MEPFRGMFARDRITADMGSAFDVSALVALIGWTLVEGLIMAALRIFARRPVPGLSGREISRRPNAVAACSRESADRRPRW